MAGSTPVRHPVAWLPAGWSVIALTVGLAVVSAVNHFVPEAYMVRHCRAAG
jgi:hypothetical protein